eukprot:1157624-Pelagomonas_calceolata.AAC.14
MQRYALVCFNAALRCFDAAVSARVLQFNAALSTRVLQCSAKMQCTLSSGKQSCLGGRGGQHAPCPRAVCACGSLRRGHLFAVIGNVCCGEWKPVIACDFRCVNGRARSFWSYVSFFGARHPQIPAQLAHK